MAPQGKAGKVWQGKAGRGEARFGESWLVKVRLGRHGTAWQGASGQVEAWYGKAGGVCRGAEWQGEVRSCASRQVTAGAAM